MHVDKDYDQIRQDLIRLMGPDYPTRLTWRPKDFEAALKASGRRQTQLQGMTGIKQPTISEIKTGGGQKTDDDADSVPRNGRPTKPTEQLYALASAMGCDLRDFADVPGTYGTGITTGQMRRLQSRLLEVEKIHTLVRPGEKIRLRDIYYRTLLIERSPLWHPSDERRPDASTAIEVDSLSDLPHGACAVLGTAGQGKSIFLRYLTIQEALREAALPLFFELRSWGEEPVRLQIFRKMQSFGLCNDDADLHNILARGQVSLLFDAFDELEQPRRKTFLRELGQLRDAHQEVRVVVTSRPDSGILFCDWLHPYSIAPLKPKDVTSLLRIYANPDEAEQIISQLTSATSEVIELLASPIFVALLIIKFRRTRSIPKRLVEFYRDLFDALVRRHNEDEGGLKRGIESKLVPYQLEKAFQEISFTVHHDFGDQPPHLRQVEDIAVVAVAGLPRPVEFPSLIVSDIIRITNLILEEAGSCFFLHKSVREYYAAAFVAGRPAVEAPQAYARIAKNWPHWRHVLSYLADLDPVRMAAMFELPELEAIVRDGKLSYLKQFSAVRIVKTQEGHEQVHIGGGTAYCARDHRIVCGSFRLNYVRDGFERWCAQMTYPELERGQAVKIPVEKIDVPLLLEWLGDNLSDLYSQCEKRLLHCRQLARLDQQ